MKGKLKDNQIRENKIKHRLHDSGTKITPDEQ